MVVVGVVLLFINAKAMWKYALTLIALGITEIVGVTLLGGDSLKAELESFAVKYWKILYGIGALMVAIGIVMLFVNAGVTWKYALTLIVAGIATVATTTILGGDTLKNRT